MVSVPQSVLPNPQLIPKSIIALTCGDAASIRLFNWLGVKSFFGWLFRCWRITLVDGFLNPSP